MYDRIDESWFVKFKNPKQYVTDKLRMLRCEMCIEPTAAEIVHLNELTTSIAIDNAVHSIIDRHWADDDE